MRRSCDQRGEIQYAIEGGNFGLGLALKCGRAGIKALSGAESAQKYPLAILGRHIILQMILGSPLTGRDLIEFINGLLVRTCTLFLHSTIRRPIDPDLISWDRLLDEALHPRKATAIALHRSTLLIDCCYSD
jgi:hypothetical protein